MTTATETATLTTDDITALREADTITFHHGPENTRYVATCIRAHIRGGYADAPRIWTAREQRLFDAPGRGVDTDRERTIMPARSTVRGYGQTIGDAVVAYHYMGGSRDTWRTITKLLRKGDSLWVEWVADNNNENIESVNFHCDQLYLHVTRGDADMAFLVATSVGPHNTARMIRPDGL